MSLSTISRIQREKLNGHRAVTLWFTGLSASGKSTIANLVEIELYKKGLRTYILDGDNIRQGINNDLNFTDSDRAENIRRVAEIAKLMNDAGVCVLVALISPFVKDRINASIIVGQNSFIEIFVDTDLDTCIKRDPKGLYKKALKGEIKHFTGIDSKYEAPLTPKIHLTTNKISSNECAELVCQYLYSNILTKS